jgi:hypothetical protein
MANTDRPVARLRATPVNPPRRNPAAPSTVNSASERSPSVIVGAGAIHRVMG